jgi:hypothetical protein
VARRSTPFGKIEGIGDVIREHGELGIAVVGIGVVPSNTRKTNLNFRPRILKGLNNEPPIKGAVERTE